MINHSIIDVHGNELLLTTDIHRHNFNAVTCSPRIDDGFGFSLLHYFIDKPYKLSNFEPACSASISRNEVCILPKSVSSKWRVLLTPSIHSYNESSRSIAKNLMLDLFNATQTQDVIATKLLITHFHYIMKYPRQHILGILDAIKQLRNKSFGELKVLSFDINGSYIAEFERDISDTLNKDCP